jgi:hypothetical protein
LGGGSGGKQYRREISEKVVTPENLNKTKTDHEASTMLVSRKTGRGEGILMILEGDIYVFLLNALPLSISLFILEPPR